MSEDTLPESIEDVRGQSLAQLAQKDGDAEGMSRILSGLKVKRVLTASFNSSI